MNTIELKNNFHHLIDTIENDALLSKFYTMMRNAKENQEGKLWKKLSEEERNELMLSFEESEDEANLIPDSEIQKKYEKWL